MNDNIIEILFYYDFLKINKKKDFITVSLKKKFLTFLKFEEKREKIFFCLIFTIPFFKNKYII